MKEFRRRGAAVLDDVLITQQLSSRPRRAVDQARVNDAFHAMARALSDKPEHVLQLLVDLVVQLCDAGSAGVSLRERAPGGGGHFRWIAVGGQLAGHAGTVTPPRSLCGVCVAHGAPQLFAQPARVFPYLADLAVPVEEALVVPVDVHGESRGTLWAFAHEATPGFDGERLRTMTALAGFAGAIVRQIDLDGAPRLADRNGDASRLAAALSAAATAMQSLSVGDVLAVAAEQARDILGARRARATLTPHAGAAPTAGLSAPLHDRDGREVGVVRVADKAAGDFTAEDEALLRQLAAIASVAVDNARLYEQAQRARSAAEAANAAKDEFLTMLTHELRDPLGILLQALGVLDRCGADAPEAARVRGLMRHHVHHLARLLDDLGDLARISRGKIQLRARVLDLRAVVDITVQAYRDRFEARGQRLDVRLPERPVHVYGDPTRLQQIAGNLLDNASRYTPQGGAIWLTVEQVNDEVLVSVRDNGIGIPPETLESIFDLFAQRSEFTREPAPRGDRGLGIGLTVVRRLTEMHGGRVHAHSAGPGLGSEFVVRLRAVRPSADARGGAVRRGRRALRILVVADAGAADDSLPHALEREGHEVEGCSRDPGSLAAALQRRPDVALIDLAGIDTEQRGLAAFLRAARDRGVRLFAITGAGKPEHVRRALDAGFEGHLTKPVATDEVLDILRVL
jgi:signal transduction histidine kinase